MSKSESINLFQGAEDLTPEQKLKAEISADPITVSEDVLLLEKFIKECIDNDYKKSKIIELAASDKYKLDYSYRSLIQKMNDYKKPVKEGGGIEALKRKENKNKGNSNSFSNEVLLIMKDIYTDKIKGGVMKRAYEDTHKDLRKMCDSFITTAGEELSIYEGNLVDIYNQQIISTHSTKFESGIYRSEREGNIIDFHVGSYESACRFLSEIEKNCKDALYLNRFGVHEFRNKRQHSMKLNYSHLQPNELIVGDGKQLDILIIDENWRCIRRPWLMGWYDMSTRRYCYELAIKEDSESIANSLFVACTKWGIPKIAKHDNGKAYLSGRFQAMKERLNIETQTATVKLARAKPIESMHNIIDHLLKTQIGYTGNNYINCPLDTKNRLKLVNKHQKQIEDIYENFRNDPEHTLSIPNNPEARLKQSKNRFMHISELIEILDEKFTEYHERTHGGLKADKLGKQLYKVSCKDELINKLGYTLNTPNGRYEYHLKKGFKPVYADFGMLAMFTSNYELRTVQIKRGLAFNNFEYYTPKLTKYIGERVLIRYSNINSKALYVYHSDGLQRIKDKTQLTSDIMRDLKFIDIAEQQRIIDYMDDASYKNDLIIQKQEEKYLKGLFDTKSPDNKVPDKPVQDSSNVMQLLPNQSEVEDIKNAEQKIINKNTKPKKNPYKDFFEENL